MTFAPARRAVTVIAFDGVLANTLVLRHEALLGAAARHGLEVTADDLLTAGAGRTVAESVDWLRVHARASWRIDETTRDLMVLTAQQLYRGQLAHGVSFVPAIVERLHRASVAGERVVLRSDSARSEVAPLLAVLGVEPLVTWLRASDDPGAPGSPPGATTVERSWHAIGERLRRWQCDATQVEVHESGPLAAAAAAHYAHRVRTDDEPL